MQIRIRIPVRVETPGGTHGEVAVDEATYFLSPVCAGMTGWIAPSAPRGWEQSHWIGAGKLELEARGLVDFPNTYKVKGWREEYIEGFERLALFPPDYPKPRPFRCLRCRRQSDGLRAQCEVCGYRGGTFREWNPLGF